MAGENAEMAAVCKVGVSVAAARLEDESAWQGRLVLSALNFQTSLSLSKFSQYAACETLPIVNEHYECSLL